MLQIAKSSIKQSDSGKKNSFQCNKDWEIKIIHYIDDIIKLRFEYISEPYERVVPVVQYKLKEHFL